jgi:type I restriction enzyme, S subunit
MSGLLSDKENPTLRFPEFSSAWEYKAIKNFTKVYDGSHQTPEYVDKGVPFYSVEHVTANNFKKTKYISEEVFSKEQKRVKLERNDILMTRIGDIGTSKLIDWDVRASFYVSLALIKDSDSIDSSFLNQLIGTNTFQKELHKRTIHVAFPRKINLGEIGNCEIIFPIEEKEQWKIANFLNAVDAKLDGLRSKRSLLAEYKLGVMQKLFSQEIRFVSDDGNSFPEWEEKRIGDVFKATRGKVLPMTETSTNQTQDKIFPVYSSQTKKNGLAGYYHSFLFENAITWTTDGANAGETKYRSGKFYCTNVCGVLLNEDGHANVFIAAYINSISRRYVSYVGNPKLMNNVMTSIKMLFPVVEEQIKIAEFLSAIDVKITAVDQQIGKMETFKKGILQQMFV